MKHERPTQRTRQYWKGTHSYEAGAWRDDETTGIADCELRIADLGKGIGKEGRLSKFDIANPDARV